jgi:D-serine deaminase-like pyridoxal phosphate-dependent protein
MSTVPLSAPTLDPLTAATLDTPALIVDLDRMDAAIERMGSYMAARGVALRPHAKTHKSLEVGRRQVAAGATGLTVGTLGEAEVFVDGGLDDLFIAYPLIPQGPKAERVAALAARATRLRIGLDSAAGARALAAALGERAGSVQVLIEVDSGGRRSGVAPSAAGALAATARERGLEVVGVFTHGGHGYGGTAAAADAADDEVRALTEAAASLAAHGVEARIVSAGSTPTATASARGAVTEERPGTYVFGDRQQAALGAVGPDAIAAGIAATVVSVDAADHRFVVDAGAKILGKDVAPYLAGHGEIPELGGAAVARIYDYHGVVEGAPGARLPEIGQVVVVLPNHICPVVNLVDSMTVVRDGRVVDRWPVDARGRNG